MKIFSLPLLMLCLSTAALAAPVQVVLKTTHGEIELALDADNAPKTVANFLRYVDEGFYDGTVFHRVIGGFMIQGGGLTPDLARKETHEPIENESENGLRNARGTIAMARTQAPHSATAQFFINHADNAPLDRANSRDGWGYAVFGKVSRGMDVVDAIAGVPTTVVGGRRDVPAETILIESATRVAPAKQ